MTTIVLKESTEKIPTTFESWEELQEYVLEQLVVKLYPLESNMISDDLIDKINKTRNKFMTNPKSFDNI